MDRQKRQESNRKSAQNEVRAQLESLLLWIVNDDRIKVSELINLQPQLATALVEKPRLYDSGICHWFYANDTALHLAAAGHRSEIVRDLINAGADPNAAHNHRRGRPLHYAADGYLQNPAFDPDEQVKTIRILLKAGAEINAPDKNGATALHRSVRTRCAAAVECLLKAGADPTLKNLPGSTPFHLAVQTTGRGGSGSDQAKAAQRKIIKSLLAHGANPNLKDEKGKSVFDWAKSDDTRRLLQGSP